MTKSSLFLFLALDRTVKTDRKAWGGIGKGPQLGTSVNFVN